MKIAGLPFQPGVACARRRQPVVHPETNGRKQPRQFGDDDLAIPISHDGVEIGDVDGGKGKHAQIARNDLSWFAAVAKRRLERPIGVPLAAAGVNNIAAHKIDDGYDFHEKVAELYAMVV